MSRFHVAFAVLVGTLAAATALTQTPAPPPPKLYDVEIRYSIEAARNDRVAQYRELLKTLKSLGFVLDESKVEDTDPEDVRATRLYGTVPTDKATQLWQVRSVRSVLLKPPEFKADVVRVQLTLNPMPSPGRQRELSDQLGQVLAGLGFKEGVSYDHRGYARMVGALPADKLALVFNDVRLVPSGWSLLPSSILADIRSQYQGGDVLETVLFDWNKNPGGRKAVAATVEEWRKEPAARRYAASLPLNPADKVDASVLEEQLIAQMAHHPDAGAALQALWDRIIRSENAPELMNLLLRRVNVTAANAALPVLYRTVAPIRLIEVQKQPSPEGRPPANLAPAGQERIDPELRELLKDEAKKTQRLRLEVLLAQTPGIDETGWRDALMSGTDVLIEGRLGSLVTVVAPAGDALKLVERPQVIGVRLPRVGRSRYQSSNPDEKPPSAIQYSGLVQLHDKGYRGKGARVAVIDSDFRGWEKAVADGKLPKQTYLLDLTRERNRTLEPDPYPSDGVTVGFGTRNAMNTARAAPEAELLLVRIDAAAPYMLQTVAAAINGDDFRSVSLDQRQHDLEVDGQLLRNRLNALQRERQEYLDNYSEDFLKDAATKKAHDALKAHQKEYEELDRTYQHRIDLMLEYRRALEGLKKVRIVSSGLIWSEGHPVDGGSALSRWFEDRPFKAALWFQAAGDTRGQAWTGLFRDADGNGVMEFTDAETPLPLGAWTNELNFLAWQPAQQADQLDLPEKVKLRFSLQWQEAHDASFAEAGRDVYRDPLANLRLVLVRQLDPEGKTQPADDVVVVAESSGVPVRLESAANGAVYEQTLTFAISKAGRYALRIEGAVPPSTRPAKYPTLPAAVKTFELRPRLFVETLDGAGRAVLHTYHTEAGSIGVPGDAHNVITIEPK